MRDYPQQFEIKHAIEKITSFVRELCWATNNHVIEWECINCSIEKYDYSALHQNLKIVKYQFCPKESDINSVYLTVDKQNDTYNLELEFADKKGTICEVHIEETCKDLLKELCEVIEEEIELSCVKKINSSIPTLTQSLRGKSSAV